MTNFEKWQQTLHESKRVEKPEDLIFDRGKLFDGEDGFRYVAMIECVECPCQKECGANHDFWIGCADIFLEWAKEEV